VDLVYYGNQGQLEYDFIVQPGADPGAIRMAVEGEQAGRPGGRPRTGASAPHGPKLSILASGDLAIALGNGEVRLRKPAVYQPEKAGRHALDGRYVLLAEGQVGFEVGEYDRSLPLIIDPTLSYTTFLGPWPWQDPAYIAADSSGAVYITGSIQSASFPVVNPLPAPNNAVQGLFDAFVTKLNPSGTALVYSTYLGGSKVDFGNGIAVDAAGNAYVVGTTWSTDFPTKGAYQSALSSGSNPWNAYVTKLNASGDALLYSTYLGGSGKATGVGIALGPSNFVYVTGSAGANFPVTTGAYQTAPHSSANGNTFVAKIEATTTGGGSLIYSTYLGGSGNDQVAGIGVDSSERAVVAGTTSSLDFPMVNAYNTVCALYNCYNAFVAKLNDIGNGLVYSTYVGAGTATSVAVDSVGNAYVAGSTGGGDFPQHLSYQQPCYPLCQNQGFVAQFGPEGPNNYSTLYGGTSFQGATSFGTQIYGIAADNSGNAYITGITDEDDFPLASPIQSVLGGGLTATAAENAFVAELNNSGGSAFFLNGLAFSSYLGGATPFSTAWLGIAADQGNAIALDGAGNIYVAGFANSVDFPVIAGGFQTTMAQNGAAFIAKIASADTPSLSVTAANTAFGQQGVNTTSASLPVLVHDMSSGSLTVASIVFGGTDANDFKETDTCGAAVAGGKDCAIAVTFTPSHTGPETATLTVTASGATGSPAAVSLSGTGLLPASRVLVTASSNPSALGASVTFTAAVSAVAPATGTPTGSVTFYDGQTSLGSGTLIGGTASIGVSTLSAGSHSITAVYGGDANFAGSTSAALTQSVTAPPPATTYTMAGPAGGALNAASASFTVAPNGPYTGTITITPSGGGLLTAIVLTFANSPAAQTFTITPATVGPVTLTPSNGGGLTNPGPLSYATPPAAPAIGSVTEAGGQITVAFTPASTGGAAITGFTAACGANTAAGGGSPIVVTGLTNGTPYTCTVTATNQYGTSVASAASSSATPGTAAEGTWVWQGQQWYNSWSTWLNSVSCVDDNNCWAAGEGYNGWQILHTADGGQTWTQQSEPAGYSTGAPASIYFVDDNNGWAVGGGAWNTTGGNCGWHVIHTTDGGQTWLPQADPYGCGWNNWTEAVFNSVRFVDANHGMAVGGDGLTLHTSDGGQTWTASQVFDSDPNCRCWPSFQAVSVIDANTAWAAASQNLWSTADGGNTWTKHLTPNWTQAPAGNWWFNGLQFVDANNGWVVGASPYGSPAGGIVFRTADGGNTWNQQGMLTTFSGLTGLSFVDANFGWVVGTASAVASSIYHTTDGGNTWNAEASPNGVGALNSVSFVDRYHGWAVGEGATIIAYTTPASSVQATASPNPSGFGANVTLTATVSAVAPATGTPTGTVTFYDGQTSLGSGTLSGGTASIGISTLAAGSHSITAAYGGDANFAGSTSPALSLTVQAAATITTLTSSPNPSAAGQTVGFTVTVTSGVSGVPAGSVALMDGSTQLGSWNLTSGQATFGLSSLGAGQHSFTAVYTPSTPSNFAGSTSSPALVQNVYSTLAISPTSAPVAGINQSYAQTFTATGGYGTLTLGETGSIPGITFTVSGSTVAMSGTPTALSPAGGYAFTITATDSIGNTLSQTYSLTVAIAVNETIQVTDTESFPDVFDAETIHVTDSVYLYTPLALGPTTIPSGGINQAYSQTFTATGGYGTLTLIETGAIPGITFTISGSTVAMSGTPTALSPAGGYTFTITATDSIGNTVSQTYTLTVTIADNETITVTDQVSVCAVSPLAIGPSSIAAGVANGAYPQTTFSATGGCGTLTLSETGAIPGIQFTVSGATLVMSGTPTAVSPVGGYAFTITATDSIGDSASQNYSLTVAAKAAMTYMVGDVAPYTSDMAPNFGDGILDIRDLIQELFAVNNISGFVPKACSDRFDAMDLYPADAASVRGGDGVLDIRDLILELFRVNNLDKARPMRATMGGALPWAACTGGSGGSSISPTEVSRRTPAPARPQATVESALALGRPERLSEGEERVPIYLEARQDLVRIALTFGLGDQQSQLRFVPTAEAPPSVAEDSQPGVVAVAWLEGLSVQAGERLLLGYVSGPAGALAGVKVYGVSASSLDDERALPIEAGAAAQGAR
jgi:photosystem II stability/assembly factor-like uncharacterized protein